MNIMLCIYIYVVVTTLARCMFWVLPCLGSCAVRFLSVEISAAFSLLIALYFLSAEMFICNDKQTSTKIKGKVERGKLHPVCFAIYVVCIFALWCLC